MFISQDASPRELEMRATMLLLAAGCTADGEKIEEIDRRQLTFERRLSWAAVRGHHTLN